MKDKLEQILKNKKLFDKTIEKAKAESKIAELQSAITDYVKESVQLSTDVKQQIESLIEGEHDLILTDSFKDWSESAVQLLGDWNSESAEIALSLYTLNEGLIRMKDSPEKLTLGELYPGIDEELATKESSWTPTELKELEDSVFGLPGNKAPIVSYESARHAQFALQEDLVEEDRSILLEKLSQFGLNENLDLVTVLRTESGIDLLSLSLEQYKTLLSGEETEDIELLNETRKVYGDSRELNEQSNPLQLVPDSLLAGLYMKQKEKSYLAPLVGIVRKYKVDKEQLEALTKAYSIFGTSVLENLLTKDFEKEETPKITSQPRAHSVETAETPIQLSDLYDQNPKSKGNN